MDTSTVLQQHQDWLDKVKKALVFNQDAARDVTLPITVKQQRIDELQRRIGDLEQQKGAVTQRFDDIIAEYKSSIAQLQAQLAADKSALQPPAVSQGPAGSPQVQPPATPAADTKKPRRRRTARE